MPRRSFPSAAAAWALEAGADEFLLPPFAPREVLARIAVLLKLQQDRQLLLTSQKEFSRLFQETDRPLFFCDPGAAACQLNPALRRLLGHPGKGPARMPVSLEDLLYGPEDRERFRQILSRSPGISHVKVNLRHREGRPVTVLLSDLEGSGRPREPVSFQVKPVGTPSTLKKAIQGLVEHLFPAPGTIYPCCNSPPCWGDATKRSENWARGTSGRYGWSWIPNPSHPNAITWPRSPSSRRPMSSFAGRGLSAGNWAATPGGATGGHPGR